VYLGRLAFNVHVGSSPTRTLSWGYSLAFSEGAASNHFIGDLKYFAFQNVLEAPSGRIPVLLYAICKSSSFHTPRPRLLWLTHRLLPVTVQNMFACITVALACGGFAERGRLPAIILFMFVWLTIVYCPIACWTWNAQGWSFIMGGLDYAGGTPVHISSGSAALAIALYLGKRRGYGTERLAYKPHNTFFVVLGTVFLWMGWFGFNGGSGLSSNLRGVMALVVTQMSASTGGIVWMLMDWRLERKFSAVGFCSGAIA
jgi:Amt family ammonium transporter